MQEVHMILAMIADKYAYDLQKSKNIIYNVI